MRLTSATVLGLAAVVSSRALYAGLVTHQMPLEVALVRFLISAAVVWAAISFVMALVGRPEVRLPSLPPVDAGAPPAVQPAAGDPPTQELPRLGG